MLRSRPALTMALLGCVFALPQGAVADFQASSAVNTTLGSVTQDTSSAGIAANSALLQTQIDNLTAQAAAATRTDVAAQFNAIIKALGSIKSYIENGYAMTGYATTTDAATLDTTITVTFRNGSDTTTTTTVSFVIPGLSDEAESSDSSTTSASGGDNADLLTQILAALAPQMGSGSQNPLSSVQNTLSNLTKPPQPLPPSTQGQTCMPTGSDGSPKTAAGSGTAVYDISAGKVYMPDGSVLEAHSGLGEKMDNPSYANFKGSGPTPPNTYTLSMRESPFHGVAALRLNPSDIKAMNGRDGILAHPPLRRSSIGSSGCMALPNYPAFLAAYKSGLVKRVVVVAGTPGSKGQGNTQGCITPDYVAQEPQSKAAQ